VSHSISKPTDITLPATSLWAKLPIFGGVAAVVGLGATLAGGERGMFSYLWAFEAFLGIALGGLGMVLIDHIVKTAWSGVLRRIAETTAVTLPAFAILFIPIATMGFHALYPWTHESDPILESKRWFLSTGFWMGRAVFYFVVWSALSWIMYSWSVKQDSSTGAETERLSRKLWQVASVGLIFWALTLSFGAIDWLMSLQPHWYSTMFGVYFFAASILAFFAFWTLVAMGLQKAGVLKDAVTTEHFHDLGKYMFGFTIFWAYIAFSQFILIWYANMPEETVFYMVRLEGGWDKVSYALPVLHFFVPFLYLVSRQVKRNRVLLAAAAIWMLVMHLVDMYWLVLPNLGTHGKEAHEAVLSLSWTDAAALVGMGGAFFAVFGFFLAKNKVVTINNPRLPESLVHENY
jgi:hypothetical protein